MNEIFNQSTIDESFKRYTINEIIEGIVVMKSDNGVVLNIGGSGAGPLERLKAVTFWAI